MSILEMIRQTDRMLEVVDDLSRHMGMSDATEFQKRIGSDDPAADVAFLEMAETLGRTPACLTSVLSTLFSPPVQGTAMEGGVYNCRVIS